ncbi:ABC transporter permease [Nocardioides marmoriginsengisoli]|uniref:ABC transporter permease n=1 Tax=Nocardioides marmoriginsengisoli TaxID=661483 RepID=A0A3N0CP22_9ACTN|nr:ABC transporter permease subunit [Nocardioides marmoriginsengisoli]RNL65195.1 ABC transporter permease [Nocardioides marmoriginsengisoli]
MSTATLERPAHAAHAPHTVDPIPMSRIVGVEISKMFNTRSGFWLMASIGIAAVLATGATLLFAPNDELTQEAFSAAIGFPMAVILPMVAILSVTSEWSQRSGLTTFTLVPHRGRVIGAKVLATLTVAVTSMLLALAVGAIGNVIGSAIAGVDTVWDLSLLDFALIVLANALGMLAGFMLGVVLRNSPAAIVGYFVISFVLPTLFMVLANAQSWFEDVWPWVDFNYAQGALFNGDPSAAEWAHLGVTGLIWLAIPLALGLRVVTRSEVK